MGSIRNQMVRSLSRAVCCLLLLQAASTTADAQQAFGRSWNRNQGSGNWDRFYHYPYVYYPQNYWGQEYYQSSDSMYFRYPAEMRIPVYNRKWHNEYPSKRLYHSGHHFNLDVF